MWELALREALQTGWDLAPIVVILGIFSVRFLSGDPAVWRRLVVGLLHIGVGLTLFRIGLDGTLLPLVTDIGKGLAAKMVSSMGWPSVLATVGFAVVIGASAALIEPTMAATAERVHKLTGGSVRPLVLRISVAAGFGLGLGLGGLRLVYGLPLAVVLVPMVTVMCALALIAPRQLVPLALDSGAIATSVVTVPIIAVYGLALAEVLPERKVLEDGFGMIVLAMIGSAVCVLATATVDVRLRHRSPATSKDRGA